MGYYYTAEPENAVLPKSWVPPKTHGPGSPVKERGHRFYIPMLGRWVNRDPLEEAGGEGLYSFNINMPLNRADALGLFAVGGNVDDGSGCCCPDYLNGGLNLNEISGNGSYGHSFQVYIRLFRQKSGFCQPCTLAWKEKTNDPYITTGAKIQQANQWEDMTDFPQLYDEHGHNPTFDSFKDIHLSDRVPANSGTMTDTPKIGILVMPPAALLVNNYYSRTLEFDITVSAGDNCPCANKSLNYKAKQTIVAYKTTIANQGGQNSVLIPIPSRSNFKNL